MPNWIEFRDNTKERLLVSPTIRIVRFLGRRLANEIWTTDGIDIPNAECYYLVYINSSSLDYNVQYILYNNKQWTQLGYNGSYYYATAAVSQLTIADKRTIDKAIEKYLRAI